MKAKTLLLLWLLALVPTAQAGLFSDDDEELRTGERHAGTTTRYAVVETYDRAGEVERVETTLVVKVEDPYDFPDYNNYTQGFLVRDRYGVVVPADSYRIDVVRDGKVVAAERCYALQRGTQAVRRDILLREEGATSGGVVVAGPMPGLFAERPVLESVPTSEFHTAPCAGRETLDWRSFWPGTFLGISEAFPELRNHWYNNDVWSEPAVRTEWNGRYALLFRFPDLSPLFLNTEPGGGGRAELVVSLGGLVKADLTLWRDTPAGRETYRLERELTGYAGGNGYIVPKIEPQAPRDRNPAATFRHVDDRAALDERAFRLAFPYAEALAHLRADPTLRFRQLEGENGGGLQLVAAHYDRRMRDPGAPNAPTDGGWMLTFVKPHEEPYHAQVVRLAAPDSPLPLNAAPRVVRAYEATSVGDARFLPFLPEVAASPALAALSEAYGVAPGAIERLTYLGVWTGEHKEARTILLVSDVSAEEAAADRHGRTLFIDLATGGLYGLEETTARAGAAGLLPSFPEARNELPQGSRSGGGFSVLAMPALGENLGWYVGGLGGLTLLLLLLAKTLLLPFYTRLRRDRLLDNPVRARLYERVRAEPGLHRAEIVDYLGVGEGAARHHLKQLVDARLLVEARHEGFVRYFAAGEVPPDVARREATLRSGSLREVYDLYSREPHLSLRDAAARLGMSAPSVHRAKKRLEKAGLLPAAPTATA